VDFRRLLVASLLSLLVVLTWPLLFPSAPAPQPEPVAAGVAGPASATDAAPVAAAAPAGGAGAVSAEAAPPSAAAPAAVPAPAPAAFDPIAAPAAARVVVETADARVELSNRGGEIVSFLAKRRVAGRQEEEELVRSRQAGPYPFALVGRDGQKLDDVLCASESRDLADGGKEVTFRYRDADRRLEKRFVFRSDNLFEVSVKTGGISGWGLYLGPGLRNPSAEQAASRFAQREGVYARGGELSTETPAKAEQPVAVETTGLQWVGLEDTYFLAALVPASPLASAVFTGVVPPAPADAPATSPAPVAGAAKVSKEDRERSDFALTVTPSGPELTVTAFMGAKDYERLAAQGLGFEKTVRWGTWGFLARPLLRALQWIFDHVVGNYGWAIVLLTVLIKIILLPLTHKSYVSMQKMAAINPKMQAIRNSYRGKMRDKNGRMNVEAQQKMNQEIMALYQREGVSPMGGCLPIALQFPVLLAFYNLLSTAVELHGAPWMAWITDLSAHDPYYVLPIVMGVSQFVQTKMTPMAGDPMQRKIFLAMPLVFTVLFLGFPSGLVLYWLTNNLLTILQTMVYNRLRAKQAA
jgi:YidC/Oxa1 family membrane protein insertase